jgi:hypothetical protein
MKNSIPHPFLSKKISPTFTQAGDRIANIFEK